MRRRARRRRGVAWRARARHPQPSLSPLLLDPHSHCTRGRYDITSLDERAGQPCDGIEDSRETIKALIDEEVANGIPLSRIVVGGFSQGGAMALYAGLQYSGTLAGVCVMSGYLAKAEGFELTEAAKATPVAHPSPMLPKTIACTVTAVPHDSEKPHCSR